MCWCRPPPASCIGHVGGRVGRFRAGGARHSEAGAARTTADRRGGDAPAHCPPHIRRAVPKGQVHRSGLAPHAAIHETALFAGVWRSRQDRRGADALARPLVPERGRRRPDDRVLQFGGQLPLPGSLSAGTRLSHRQLPRRYTQGASRGGVRSVCAWRAPHPRVHRLGGARSRLRFGGGSRHHVRLSAQCGGVPASGGAHGPRSARHGHGDGFCGQEGCGAGRMHRRGGAAEGRGRSSALCTTFEGGTNGWKNGEAVDRSPDGGQYGGQDQGGAIDAKRPQSDRDTCRLVPEERRRPGQGGNGRRQATRRQSEWSRRHPGQ
eukprot:ctg_949.g216